MSLPGCFQKPVLLENLPAHVTSESVDVMFDTVLKHLDTRIPKPHQCLAGIVSYPPLLIRDSLKKESNLILCLKFSQCLHDGTPDFPGGILTECRDLRDGGSLSYGGECPDAVQPDIQILMMKEVTKQQAGLLQA